MTYISPNNFKVNETISLKSNNSDVRLVAPTGVGNNFRILLPSITGQLAVVSQLSGGGSITSSSITDFSEAVDDRVASLLVQSTGINIDYNDGTNTIILKATGLITDHGLLSGLGDDDHTQYHNNTRGDLRYVQLAGSYSDPAWISTIKWSTVNTTPTTIAGYGITDAALNTITISAGTGLIGGGSLSSNRIFHVSFGTGINNACVGNDSRLSDARTPLTHSHTSSDITDFAESVDDRVSSLVLAGTGVTIIYNDASNSLTINVTGIINDHGNLYGLSDDDHTQYHNDARGDARYVSLAGSYANPTWLSSLAWSKISSTPTTLAGYAISDAVSNTLTLTAGTGLIGGGSLASDRVFNVLYGTSATTACVGNDSRLSDARTPLTHTHTSSDITDIAETIDDRVNTLFVAGTGIAIVYNDAANTFTIAATGSSGGGVTDHGLLTGLADDDHSQYHNDTRGDARYPQLAGSYSNPTWMNSLAWSKISSTPTTVAGYGISDAVINTTQILAGTGLIGGGTLASNNTLNVVFGTTATTSCAGNDSRLSDARTPTAHTHTVSEITDFAEGVDDRINSLFVAGTGMAIVYNDVANTFTISATGTSGGSPSSGPTYSKILSYINIG